MLFAGFFDQHSGAVFGLHGHFDVVARFKAQLVDNFLGQAEQPEAVPPPQPAALVPPPRTPLTELGASGKPLTAKAGMFRPVFSHAGGATGDAKKVVYGG